MATTQQLDAVGRIVRLAMHISMQGKYHVFAQYSGHIDKFEVYAHPSYADYQSHSAACVDGMAHQDYWLNLAHEDGQLAELESKLIAMLDRDEDGVPI